MRTALNGNHNWLVGITFIYPDVNVIAQLFNASRRLLLSAQANPTHGAIEQFDDPN